MYTVYNHCVYKSLGFGLRKGIAITILQPLSSTVLLYLVVYTLLIKTSFVICFFCLFHQQVLRLL